MSVQVSRSQYLWHEGDAARSALALTVRDDLWTDEVFRAACMARIDWSDGNPEGLFGAILAELTARAARTEGWQ